MISRHIIHTTALSPAIRPLHIHLRSLRAIISHRIPLTGLRLPGFAPFQLIPRIVRQPVPVLILHHPHDPRLRTPGERIPGNPEIILPCLIIDTMVETHHHITAETTQRHIRLASQPFFGIGTRLRHRRSRITFIHKLSRSRQKLIHPVTFHLARRRRFPVIRPLCRHTLHLHRRTLHRFSVTPGHLHRHLSLSGRSISKHHPRSSRLYRSIHFPFIHCLRRRILHNRLQIQHPSHRHHQFLLLERNIQHRNRHHPHPESNPVLPVLILHRQSHSILRFLRLPEHIHTVGPHLLSLQNPLIRSSLTILHRRRNQQIPSGHSRQVTCLRNRQRHHRRRLVHHIHTHLLLRRSISGIHPEFQIILPGHLT